MKYAFFIYNENMENNFERKIYQKLLKWKENNTGKNKTALLLKGARQIGKTTIALDFAQREYENVVYINFHTMPSYIKLFDGDLDTDTLISRISASSNFKFVPYKTVIIFDEIQECSKARTSFKPFCLDGKYDVIATGSLLGVSGFNKNPHASIPVGFETHLTMYPMDFKEYLWAIDFNKDILSYLEKQLSLVKQIDEIIHEQLLKHYLDYLIVGGMPKAVKKFKETKDFNVVREEQLNILSSYRDDFGKYTNSLDKTTINNKDAIKLKKVFDNVPVQLAREENPQSSNSSTKFRFNEVTSGGKFRNFIDAINWLKEAGVISVCNNLSNVSIPLKSYQIENQLKIYLNDTGLLLASLEKKVTTNIYEKKDFIYKGYIYENLIADALTKNNIPLYFHSIDSRLEVDFVVSTEKDLLVLEVKSGKNNPRSLKKLISTNKDIRGIKLSKNNIGYCDGILTIPYYLAYLIDEDFIYPEV